MANHEKKEFFENLTMNALAQWAGSEVMSRGMAYQHEGRVRKLALRTDEGLVGWVAGTWQYATSVDVKEGGLISQCSCLYGERCKHAVAVVLQYAEDLKNKKLLETVDDNDERLIILKKDAFGTFPTMSEYDESYDELISKIDTLSLEEARSIVKSIVDLFPEVHKYMADRFLLSSGNMDKIVSATEREIYDLTSQPAWADHWDHEDELPDYSGIRKRFEILLSSGQYGDVLRLGKILLTKGTEQVGDSNDEGETEEEIASCMDIVFKALLPSSMPAVDKMMWAVQAGLEDEYGMTRGLEEFWAHHFEPSDWSALADSLKVTLLNKESLDLHSFSKEYQRNKLTDWIIRAMENSGRSAESLSLCREEAERTHSYVRLVKKLVNAGMHEEAEEWIRRGVDETADSLPGIAGELRKILQDVKEKEKDWLGVSSLLAEEYMEQPSIKTYEMLEEACGKVKVWPPVRQHILRFLETGNLPGTEGGKGGKAVLDVWPLPETGLKIPQAKYRTRFPKYSDLIEVAIYENIPSIVLHWYDLSQADPNGKQHDWNWPTGELRVARAIFGEFPDRAISIFKGCVENEIAQTNKNSYEAAVYHLSELGKLMEEKGRKGEWEAYTSELRQANSRKSRFLKTLDMLSGKRIMDL